MVKVNNEFHISNQYLEHINNDKNFRLNNNNNYILIFTALFSILMFNIIFVSYVITISTLLIFTIIKSTILILSTIGFVMSSILLMNAFKLAKMNKALNYMLMLFLFSIMCIISMKSYLINDISTLTKISPFIKNNTFNFDLKIIAILISIFMLFIYFVKLKYKLESINNYKHYLNFLNDIYINNDNKLIRLYRLIDYNKSEYNKLIFKDNTTGFKLLDKDIKHYDIYERACPDAQHDEKTLIKIVKMIDSIKDEEKLGNKIELAEKLRRANSILNKEKDINELIQSTSK